MTHPNKDLMEKAIELAKTSFREGGHAVAAVIVCGDEIIAEAYTTLRKDNDPTAHAEINAIREASKKLGTRNLEDCYLYTTYEPCPMCSSACVWARMKGIIYGASRDDQTPEHPWRVYIPVEEVMKNGTPKLELYAEFMRDECRDLLKLSA